LFSRECIFTVAWQSYDARGGGYLRDHCGGNRRSHLT
jgi:hypothetical protein